MNLSEIAPDEPVREITLGSTSITLLGTAHVSRTSEAVVRRLIGSGHFELKKYADALPDPA